MLPRPRILARARRASVATLCLLALPLMANDCDSSRFDDLANGRGSGSGSAFVSTATDVSPEPGPGPAIPEPGAFLLFAVGAALGAGAARRARKR
jgi:hypothetical protein